MKKNKTPMTQKDASRIQSHSDRTGSNKDFKSRAQSTAAKNGGDRKGSSGSKGK